MRPGTWAWLFRKPPCCGKRLSPGCSPENSGLKNTVSLSQLKGPLTSTFSNLGRVTFPAQGAGLSAAVLQREPGNSAHSCDSVAWPVGGEAHPPHDRHPQRPPAHSRAPCLAQCRVGLLDPCPHTYQPPPPVHHTPQCSQMVPTLLRNMPSGSLSRGACQGAARVAARAPGTAHGAVMDSGV